MLVLEVSFDFSNSGLKMTAVISGFNEHNTVPLPVFVHPMWFRPFSMYDKVLTKL